MLLQALNRGFAILEKMGTGLAGDGGPGREVLTWFNCTLWEICLCYNVSEYALQLRKYLLLSLPVVVCVFVWRK